MLMRLNVSQSLLGSFMLVVCLLVGVAIADTTYEMTPAICDADDLTCSTCSGGWINDNNCPTTNKRCIVWNNGSGSLLYKVCRRSSSGSSGCNPMGQTHDQTIKCTSARQWRCSCVNATTWQCDLSGDDCNCIGQWDITGDITGDHECTT